MERKRWYLHLHSICRKPIQILNGTIGETKVYKYSGKVIRAGRSWSDNDGVTHPSSWMRWSDEEKAAKGLVWEDDPALFDSRYYWDANTPKALEDVDAVDDEGNPVLDADGNQVVTLGLKSQAIAKAKQQAGGELAATDWYVIRAAEGGTPVPSEVLSERQSIRDNSNTKEAAINACTTLEEFIALENPVVDLEV